MKDLTLEELQDELHREEIEIAAEKIPSESPRTDAQITGLVRLYPQSMCQTEVVSARFARELEHDLNEEKSKSEKAVSELKIQIGHHKIRREISERKLAELAASLDRCANAWNTNEDVPYWVWQSMRQMADKALEKPDAPAEPSND